jgi:secondary thiamine-phosphate synthase enzyme
MIQQIEFQLPAMRRGCHLITDEITRLLTNPLPKYELLNVFVKHTSCGLTINENADPDVRMDMDNILDNIVPENEPYYNHTMEGADDMAAHAKSSLIGVSLTIPITNGRLNLGTWQGIYLCEFRDYGGERSIVLSVYS